MEGGPRPASRPVRAQGRLSLLHRGRGQALAEETESLLDRSDLARQSFSFLTFSGGHSKSKVHDEIYELKHKSIHELEWVLAGRMRSPRYSHAVTSITFHPDLEEDCRDTVPASS